MLWRPPRSWFAATYLGLAVVLSIASLGGCGGSDGDESGSVEPGATPVTEASPSAVSGAAPTPSKAAVSAPSARPGTGIEIRLARGEDPATFAQAAIYRRLLLELGYTVTVGAEGDLSAPAAFAALAGGNLDVWTGGLFPIDDQFLSDELFDGGTVGDRVRAVGVQTPAGVMQGILVNRDWATSNSVAYVDDIASNPDLAVQLDVDGDGTPDVFGCRQGTTCEVLVNRLFVDAGWTVAQITETTGSLLADAAARMATGAPTLLYGWTPSDVVVALQPGRDVVWLSVRNPTEAAANEANLPVEECPARPCVTGFIASDIRAVANAEFLDANPPARALLEQVQISVVDVSAQNQLVAQAEDVSAAIDRVASEWIITNRPLINSWLQVAVAAS